MLPAFLERDLQGFCLKENRMEYTAEIWFGNVVVNIELENYNGIGENSVLEVAKKVSKKAWRRVL